jgi:REP element-mobilizing transposase RayT
LAQPDIARLVIHALHEATARNSCSLHAFVFMPNHVPVLWTPQIALSELVRRVKGPTAHDANKLLGRTGEQFWQQEYFDRAVRNEEEFARITRYIEWNPVKAGLIANPEEFLWSSAYDSEGGSSAEALRGLKSTFRFSPD